MPFFCRVCFKFNLISIDFGSGENLEPKENSNLYLTIDPSDNISTILVFKDYMFNFNDKYISLAKCFFI